MALFKLVSVVILEEGVTKLSKLENFIFTCTVEAVGKCCHLRSWLPFWDQ